KPTAQPRREPLPATLPSITQLVTQRAGRALGSLLQPRRKTCTSLSRRSREPRPSIPNRAANLIHPFLSCLRTPLTQPLHRRGHRRIQRLGNFERHRLHRAGKPGHKRRPSPDRKSIRLNSSHVKISYAVFCLKKKNNKNTVDRSAL